MKRWDFDNEEDYNSYQSNREALPRFVSVSFHIPHSNAMNHSFYIIIHFRAAFQYGVKMSEGRKTRRFGGGMTGKAKEKAKLNREWQQISAVRLFVFVIPDKSDLVCLFVFQSVT